MKNKETQNAGKARFAMLMNACLATTIFSDKGDWPMKSTLGRAAKTALAVVGSAGLASLYLFVVDRKSAPGSNDESECDYSNRNSPQLRSEATYDHTEWQDHVCSQKEKQKRDPSRLL